MSSASLPESVRLPEVGAREGFQTHPSIVPTPDKIALVDALSRTGVKDIEVASFVRGDRVPNMADAAEVSTGCEKHSGVRYTGLYLNVKGFQRAEEIEGLENQGWLNIAASEEFLQRNNNTTIDRALSTFPTWIEAFRGAGKSVHGLMLSTAFGSNYEGRIPTEAIVSLVQRILNLVEEQNETLGEICLADTMGNATPTMLQERVHAVRESAPDAEVTLHLHDTRGVGIANVLAGLEVGVRTFDASVGGLGGCPFAKGAAGNVCTEDIAFLCEEMGIHTGIDLEAYVEAAKLAESIIGKQLPGRFYRAVPMP